MNITEQKQPSFLNSYGDMFSFFQGQFEGMENASKGDSFLKFSIRLIAFTELGESYHTIEPSTKKTHDKGIDAQAKSKDDKSRLYIQSKYVIPTVDEFDSIISKFMSFQNTTQDFTEPSTLFSHHNMQSDNKFVIVTASKLDIIVDRYKNAKRSSKSFFDELEQKKSIIIIDGVKILSILQKAYRKLHILPSDLELSSQNGFLNQNNVWIGIVSSKNLVELYEQFGDALFLENIREYLGEYSGKVEKNRDTVNKAMIKTLSEEPQNFLSRNNGITFRAEKVEKKDNNKIVLKNASIVNGCQTTMSIIAKKDTSCYVLAKIVESEDTWDVAKSANYQNHVSQIDLEIAQYIRPQIVRNIATRLGFKFDAQAYTPFSLIEEINQSRVNYNSIRGLFIGIFSKNPSNSSNYTEINTIALDDFFKDEDNGRIFEILFTISQETEKASEIIIKKLPNEDGLGTLFQRFWKEENSQYRSFLAILTSCGVVSHNLFSNRNELNYQNIKKFLNDVDCKIKQDEKKFMSIFLESFKIIALEVLKTPDRDKALQIMYRKIKESNFNMLFDSLSIQNIRL